MKRQKVDPFDVPKRSGEIGQSRDLVKIIRQARDKDKANPHWTVKSSKPPSEFQNCFVVVTGDSVVQLGRESFHPEHHEVDRLQIFVAQAVVEASIRIERGVNSKGFCCRKKFEHETMLKQRLAATNGKTAVHRSKGMTVLVHDLHCSGVAHGHPVFHLPSVGVMAEDTAELTTGEPT